MIFRLVLLMLLVSGLCGCKRKGAGVPSGGLYVVTTTGMLADAVKNVGGKWVRVEGLMGPSVDPHLYRATASDTAKLSRAKLIIYNGLHLEGKMQSLLEKMGRFRPVVAATDRIPSRLFRTPKDMKGTHDPHVWFDVSLWMRVVTRVGEALAKVDPKHRLVYEANAKAYNAKLSKLHAWAKVSLAMIAKDRRFLVTSHDAFGYFGRAYGLQVVGLQGVSTVAEAGVKDVERVIGLLVKQKLPAIFSETSVSDKMIRAVMQGCATRKHKLSLGGKLYSDAMGAPGTPEGTYIGMVRHNVRVVVKALAGKDAPALSLSGGSAAKKPVARRIVKTRPVVRRPVVRRPVSRR